MSFVEICVTRIEFNQTQVFSTKPSRQPPKDHPNLDVFLTEFEKKTFKISAEHHSYSNMSKKEWEATKTLVDDRKIAIEKADKGLWVVI